MPIASKISRLMDQGSWIRRMFEEGIELKRQYGEENVFDLSLGNPIMEPPPEFFEELRRLANDPDAGGCTATCRTPGYPDGCVAAVAAQLAEETGLPFGEDHALMTVGAGGALNVTLLKTLLDPGDEAVIVRALLRGVPVLRGQPRRRVQGGAAGRAVSAGHGGVPGGAGCEDAHRASSTRRTTRRGFCTRSETCLRRLARRSAPSGARARDGDIPGERRAVPQASCSTGWSIRTCSTTTSERAIVATSHSKDLALPGERIGYVAIHPHCPDGERLMDGLVFCNRTLGFVNAPALMQRIVAKLQDVTVDVCGLPAEAGLSVRGADGHRLRGYAAGRGVLHVPALAGGG